MWITNEFARRSWDNAGYVEVVEDDNHILLKRDDGFFVVAVKPNQEHILDVPFANAQIEDIDFDNNHLELSEDEGVLLPSRKGIGLVYDVDEMDEITIYNPTDVVRYVVVKERVLGV